MTGVPSPPRRVVVVVVVALICVVALVVGGVVVVRALRGLPVDTAGGTVASDDDTVQVRFGPGEVDDGTRIQLRTGLGGPPPPADIVPLGRPFDITAVRGHARTGTVTVHAALPPDVAPGLVVMLVEEDAGWRVLDTTYDPATATATAAWPHFSRGFLGFVNPLADLGRDAAGGVVGAAQWSGEQFDRFAGWAQDRGAEAVKVVAAGVVAALGGTLDNVTCDPAGTDWEFRAEGTALLTGCAGPPADDAWPAKIGNRAPYPMLVTLPDGVTGPGWREVFTSVDLEDAVVTTLWGLTGRTVVPAGKSMGVGLHRGTGDELHLRGHTDYSTLAVKVVALVAIAMSAGETLLIRKAVEREMEILNDLVVQSRRQGGPAYTLADAARDTGPDSLLGRMRADTSGAFTAEIVDQAFTVLGLVNCAIASAKSARDLDSTLALMWDACFPPFVAATVRNTLGVAKDLVDPHVKEKLAGELARELAAEALNIRKGVTAVAAEPLSVVLPWVDLTGPELVVRCAAAGCTSTAPDPVPTPSDPGTEVYALLTAAGSGSVTYDQIDWFWAPDAARACAEDHVVPGDNAWCTDYYFRNVNPRLRTAPLGPAARITVVGDTGTPVEATPAQLAAKVARGVGFRCSMRLTGGVVTELTEIYTP